jgi:hypothetical protein
MGASEFSGWQDYHNRVPFVAERQDILISNLIALTANINRGKDAPAFEAKMFTPWVKYPEVKKSVKESNQAMVAEKNSFKAKFTKVNKR